MLKNRLCPASLPPSIPHSWKISQLVLFFASAGSLFVLHLHHHPVKGVDCGRFGQLL